MTTGPKLSLRDLPLAVRQALPPGASRGRSFEEGASPLDLHATERRLINQALSATKGNITAAAKKLGISRRTLHRKINEMGGEKSNEEKPEIRMTKSETGSG
jgi:DNA-binding NtrC family response regulator